jgi:hypothetical protein
MPSSTITEAIPPVEEHATSPFVAVDTNANPPRLRSTTLYAVTIFLSAFLLFQVQLIIAKYVLPWFGGSPSVWNTCLLLFQLLLLSGYLYAHVVSTRLTPSSQTRLHLVFLFASLSVLAVMALQWPSPITPGAAWKPAPGGSQEWHVILLLVVSVGFPFLVLSTTGPLLQVWLSRAQPGSPYRLYALSNAGSLLGLLSYPFLEERFLLLRTQALLWSGGYALFLLAYAVCAWVLQRYSSTAHSASIAVSNAAEKPKKAIQALWLAFAACATAMLLATTNLICQEIAVIPLLWVLPLCVYLLTFIICFGNERWYRRSIFYLLYALAFFAALIILSAPAQAAPHILVEISVFCMALFAVCMVCHGELVKRKPAPDFLSTFYLTIAAGGALGSILVVLVAPRIFQRFWEFQLGLLFCGILLLTIVLLNKASWFYKRPSLRVVLYAALLAFLFQGYNYAITLFRPEAGARIAFRDRNFFGVKTGMQDHFGNWLMHGRTRHGVQLSDPAVHDEPTLYYKRLSGVGLILDRYPTTIEGGGKRRALRIGVVGLGAGTVAAYGHLGDYFRFYEIDPQVVALSLGQKPWFSFVQDSAATIDIVMGDARLSLEREAATGHLQKFDVLVLDAFSSDSIPMHLLTKEAMALYLRHLNGPNSVIAFHLSNRSLDLRPVADGLSREYRMTSVEVEQPGFSVWVLASANPYMMNFPELQKRSKPVTVSHAVPLWTDEYSNLFNVLKPIR